MFACFFNHISLWIIEQTILYGKLIEIFFFFQKSIQWQLLVFSLMELWVIVIIRDRLVMVHQSGKDKLTSIIGWRSRFYIGKWVREMKQRSQNQKLVFLLVFVAVSRIQWFITIAYGKKKIHSGEFYSSIHFLSDLFIFVRELCVMPAAILFTVNHLECNSIVSHILLH